MYFRPQVSSNSTMVNLFFYMHISMVNLMEAKQLMHNMTPNEFPQKKNKNKVWWHIYALAETRYTYYL